MRIRFLKDYESADKQYPIGAVMDCNDEGAAYLIDEGIAEKYVPQKDDILITDPNLKTDLKDEVIKEIKEDFAQINRQNAAEEKAFSQTKEGHILKTGNYNSFNEFLVDVKNADSTKYGTGMTSPRLKNFLDVYNKVSGMQVGIGNDGGFAVPTEFRAELLQNTLQSPHIIGRCRNIPVGANSVEIPTINESSRASNVYGGITIYRRNEGVTLTGSKPKLGLVKMELAKTTALVYLTSELISDSAISMEPLLRTLFTQAMTYQMEEDIINGQGAGQPLGVLNSPCLVSTTRTTSSQIQAEDIVLMWSRLLSAAMGNSVWLAHQDTTRWLYLMEYTVGSGGAGMGLVDFNGRGLVNPAAAQILGRPQIFSEHCQSLGTAGDLILGDFNYYLLCTKASSMMDMATSIHIKFDTDEVAFRFIMRYDGQPWMQSALTPKHGSNTLTAFVAIAA